MSDIGGLVDELIAAGTPPGMAAQIVARAFAAGVAAAPVRVTSADESVTRRKENDRIRQQRRRDNLRTSADLRDNPQMSQNASLSIESKKEEIKKKRESNKAVQLESDWRPSPEAWAQAVMILGSDERAEHELTKFKNHAAEKGRTSKKWNSAWANWAIRAVEYGGKNGQSTSTGGTAGFAGSAPTGDDAVVTGMARALERRRAERGAIDPGRAEFRTGAGDGFTAGDAAESGATTIDHGSHRQLALIPRGNG
jgi:hypothetical protein